MNAYRMDHGLYGWSPIVSRDPLVWPNRARIAVAFVVSLGHFEAEVAPGAFDPPTHRSPLRMMPPPDYPTVTHREYGHRVGIFRLFELFDAHAMRATGPSMLSPLGATRGWWPNVGGGAGKSSPTE